MPDIIDGSMILKVTRWSLFLLAATPFAMAGERLGDIEFFGYQGFDVAKIRAALPVHEGGEFSQQTAVSLIREAVAAAIGQQPTDVSTICCDELGNRLLFIRPARLIVQELRLPSRTQQQGSPSTGDYGALQ